MNRRHFITTATGGSAAAAMLGLTGCAATAPKVTPSTALPVPVRRLALAPIRAERERLFRITVCLRPFRPAGPRLDVETLAGKTVVHNYGHGGSGWSLSWGSAAVVKDKAMAALAGAREVAVIGCGALGMTAAITLQQAGAKVTIYTKDRPLDTRSSRATGTWSPDSRIALTNAAPAGFATQWETMARRSYHVYHSYLGSSGAPVEWTDRYQLRDAPSGQPRTPQQPPSRLEFAHYMDRIADITPGGHALEPGTHPFPTPIASATTSLSFNIASFSRQLLNEFLLEGGRIQFAEFHSPAEFATIPERVIVNCTGYGARALLGDESVVPVRGQIGWLVPQPECNYGVIYNGIMVLARRDGIVVQAFGATEELGYNISDETPDRKEAEAAIDTVAPIFANMR